MNERWITLTLQTRTALHLGSGEGNNVTDALLRRDAQGRLFLPGSAIAGALRAIATRLAPRLYPPICQALQERPSKTNPCGCAVCRLFGDINPQEQDEQRPHNKEGGFASPLWVYDAHLAPQATSIRDGVGIDRTSGAAARQGSVKFDLELLPANQIITLRMKLATTGDDMIDARNEQLLAVVFAEWQGGRGAFGGRVARGLGSFQVKNIVWQEQDLRERSRLMQFLKRATGDWQLPAMDQATRIKTVKQAQPISPWTGNNRLANLSDYAVARAWAEAELVLHFTGPLLINDLVKAKQGGFDHAPLAGVATNSLWVLPGSSLRGVLRSQAERIARTIATQQAVAQPDPRAYFLAHNPAGDPNMRRAAAPLANSDALLTAAGLDGEVRIKPGHLDLADQLFGSVRLGSRLVVEDGELVPPVALKAMDFLAIDRFTGGGRDSAKFDAIALWQPRFKVRLRLDNPTAWELGWLLLTLRDLHAGLATIGFGGAKGFGRVIIHRAQLTLGYLCPDDFPATQTNPALLAPETVDEATLWSVVRAEWTPSMTNAPWLLLVNEWVTAFNSAITTFSRLQPAEVKTKVGVPCQVDDSYFTNPVVTNPVMTKLYPVATPVGEEA